MEKPDRELILQMMSSDMELRRLYERHMVLESSLTEYGSRIFLTADEEMDSKRLKKEKLQGVDRMMEILGSHRVEDTQIQVH